jgi:2-amino-4-hydroxy-6-hydroxymethyldihydropteridine diphosphokinase
MTPPPTRAYIGLGANLDDPEAQVLRAFDELGRLPGVALDARSSLYRTAPVGYAAQPDFVNAVAEISTTLPPYELLARLQNLENRHGRIREFKNGPRTLDLDLLIYGSLRVASASLVLPHPYAHRRAFVLLPLLEIAPDCVIPGLGPARSFVECCRDQAAIPIADGRLSSPPPCPPTFPSTLAPLSPSSTTA